MTGEGGPATGLHMVCESPSPRPASIMRCTTRLCSWHHEPYLSSHPNSNTDPNHSGSGSGTLKLPSMRAGQVSSSLIPTYGYLRTPTLVPGFPNPTLKTLPRAPGCLLVVHEMPHNSGRCRAGCRRRPATLGGVRIGHRGAGRGYRGAIAQHLTHTALESVSAMG